MKIFLLRSLVRQGFVAVIGKKNAETQIFYVTKKKKNKCKMLQKKLIINYFKLISVMRKSKTVFAIVFFYHFQYFFM